MKCIFTGLLITVLMIVGCTMPPPPQIPHEIPVPKIDPEITPEKVPAPTAPASIDGKHIGIVDADLVERFLTKRALEFCYARASKMFDNGFLQRLEVHANNVDKHFVDITIDDRTVIKTAGHYELEKKIVCVLRGKITLDIIFHEVEHGCTLWRKSTPEGQAILKRWAEIVPATYGYASYAPPITFPYKHFLTRYSTLNAEEHRAEWKRYLYLLLYERWLQSTGAKVAFPNPLKKITPDDTWRAMLNWSLECGDITQCDFDNLRDFFKIPDQTPKK